MRNLDRFRGCLVGGAAGDALGYEVEFMTERLIFSHWGPQGITEYALHNGVAQFSDDTQMTLFTAAGLLETGEISGIRAAYLDWYKTQRDIFRPEGKHLMGVRGLFERRAPGNTCLDALHRGAHGTPETPINRSKGCGGVMRMAPIGLFFNDRAIDVREVARLGAEAAALTHGHPLGWLPGAVMAQVVHEVSQDGTAVAPAVRHALRTAAELWPDAEPLPYLTKLLEHAITLAAEADDELEAIHKLGAGWVGEEALAIAVFSVLRCPGDFNRAIILAVNHEGDSDSTGAIAGNIIGAQIGLSNIPEKYKTNLELYPLLLDTADALWRGSWE